MVPKIYLDVYILHIQLLIAYHLAELIQIKNTTAC